MNLFGKKNLLAGFAAFLLFFIPVSSFAQSSRTVKATLTDSESGEPVAFATVSLTLKDAKSPSKYVLSTDKGVVLIEGVKNGSYTLKAELMGYKPYTMAVTMAEGKPVDLGVLKMEPDAKVLEAASVSAVGNPVIVKKDTIEYNASSFKTTDNDMLENLLKKLPGVEVSSDGTITANGQEIKKITIDGKTFFLDDPSLASKNIPAKIVEKVKVVEKKSDQALFTGIDDGEEETVIDLMIKPGMMNGWFGNVMAGGGHDVPQKDVALSDGDWRYQGAAMVGRFTKDSQISVILNGNNTNNRGFNDMAGSMMQSMRGGGGGMGMGRGGFGGGNGITTSYMGGANGAFTLLDGDMDLASNYLFNASLNSVKEQSHKLTYLDGGDRLIYDNDGFSNTNSYGHRFGIRLEHKFSENTSIIFEPQVNFGNGNYTQWSDFTTDRLFSESGETSNNNSGFSNNTGVNHNWTTSGFLLLRQKLGKPGRTISVHTRYSFSGNSLDGYNQSLTTNYQSSSSELGQMDEIVNQRIESISNSQSVNARLSYTEPLAKKLFLEATYSYSWNRSVSDKNTYDSALEGLDKTVALASAAAAFGNDAGTLNETYSNDILNRAINHRAGLNLQYQTDKLGLQIGASANPTNTHNETNGEVYDSKVIKWAPQAMLRYEFNDYSSLAMFYRGSSSQPSTSQLMPVPDNSNPLSVSFGNPYLLPYFSHSLRGRFGYSNKQTFFTVRGFFNAGMVQDPITSALWYDNAGAQYTMPINGPMSGNGSLGFFMNIPLGKNGFSIQNFMMNSYSQSSSYVGKQSFNTGDYYNAETADFNYERFNADFFDHDSPFCVTERIFDDYFTTSRTQNYNLNERFTFKYSGESIEVNLGASTRMSKSWYTVTTGSQKPRWSNQASASFNWTAPGGITVAPEYKYNWYVGYDTDQPDEHILNATISKLLFKNQFTLAITGYDILNQSKNLTITDNNNYHQEVRNNTLGRYVILSLTYRFGNFAKAGQNMRGPGGHGGPGGPGGPGGRP